MTSPRRSSRDDEPPITHSSAPSDQPTRQARARNDPSPQQATRTHRLSVNINEESAEVLRQVTAMHGISTTEAVRRAIGLLRFFEEEQARGSEVFSKSSDGEVSKVIRI